MPLIIKKHRSHLREIVDLFGDVERWPREGSHPLIDESPEEEKVVVPKLRLRWTDLGERILDTTGLRTFSGVWRDSGSCAMG